MSLRLITKLNRLLCKNLKVKAHFSVRSLGVEKKFGIDGMLDVQPIPFSVFFLQISLLLHLGDFDVHLAQAGAVFFLVNTNLKSYKISHAENSILAYPTRKILLQILEALYPTV